MATILSNEPKFKRSKLEAHVSQYKRIQKAHTLIDELHAMIKDTGAQDLITITVQGEHALVKSSDPKATKPYSVTFNSPDGWVNCDCMDFVNRNATDLNNGIEVPFECYHIIAARLLNEELFG